MQAYTTDIYNEEKLCFLIIYGYINPMLIPMMANSIINNNPYNFSRPCEDQILQVGA